MPTYEVGQTVQWGLTTKDAAGGLANVGEGPTAVVTLPDATTASATITNPSTGSYIALYASAQAGRHRIQWDGGGLNSGGLPYTDFADVWPSDPRFLLPLADARAALNLRPADVAQDDELRLYIAATTSVIEDITGPILPNTVAEVHSGDLTDALILDNYPTAITSVVVDAVTVSTTSYGLSPSGVLWKLDGWWSAARPSNITVTYTVGETSVPPNVLLAAREELRFLWQIGQSGARPALAMSPGGPVGYTPAGYAVPRRVIELLGSWVGRNKAAH